MANGLSALSVSVKLNQAAYGYSYDMGQRDYYYYPISQNTKEPYPLWLGGPTASDRIKHVGYTGFSVVEENIAHGYSTADGVFAAWKGSSPHNAKMLSASVTQIGIGFALNAGSTYRNVWTIDLSNGNDGSPTGCP